VQHKPKRHCMSHQLPTSMMTCRQSINRIRTSCLKSMYTGPGSGPCVAPSSNVLASKQLTPWVRALVYVRMRVCVYVYCPQRAGRGGYHSPHRGQARVKLRLQACVLPCTDQRPNHIVVIQRPAPCLRHTTDCRSSQTCCAAAVRLWMPLDKCCSSQTCSAAAVRLWMPPHKCCSSQACSATLQSDF